MDGAEPRSRISRDHGLALSDGAAEEVQRGLKARLQSGQADSDRLTDLLKAEPAPDDVTVERGLALLAEWERRAPRCSRGRYGVKRSVQMPSVSCQRRARGVRL